MKNDSKLNFNWALISLAYFCRIDLQDKVRRLAKDPREEARSEVERLRQRLTAEFLVLHTYPNSLGLSGEGHSSGAEDADPSAFDNLDDESNEVGAGPDSDSERQVQQDNDMLPPEQRSVILPSSHLQIGHALGKKELALRVKQAARYLAAIREAVAEKSFQYSHVMRKAPSKSVRTRSRASISNLNNRIALCCRVYGRARTALVQLGADDKTLNTFRILLKEDVKASTAILDPNIAGSSSLQLSWIWHTHASYVNSESGPEMMRECESPTFIHIVCFKNNH